MSDAIERYQAMLAQNPANGLARFSLAKALFDAGRLEEAGAEFRIALKAKPEFMLAQILLGKCELGLGRKDSAKAAFERGGYRAASRRPAGGIGTAPGGS